jgi:large subunit ribosomal protein L28
MTKPNPNIFKRGQRGLYGGKRIRFGNNVSFSERKTRRNWKPNKQIKNFYSELLNKSLKLRVTTYAMRWIDKVGGLDNYLLFTKPQKLYSQFALKLRSQLINEWEKKNNIKFNRSKILLIERNYGIPFTQYLENLKKK